MKQDNDLVLILDCAPKDNEENLDPDLNSKNSMKSSSTNCSIQLRKRARYFSGAKKNKKLKTLKKLLK